MMTQKINFFVAQPSKFQFKKIFLNVINLL